LRASVDKSKCVAIPNSDFFHARTATERLRKLIGGAPFLSDPTNKKSA
jgi:hypothetical protein